MSDSNGRTETASNGAGSAGDPGVGPSSVALFALLWEALADLLGTAATAALLRRAVRRAAPRCPELGEIAIVRENLDYRYALPPSWNDRGTGREKALRSLVGELLPLLEELTGTLVIAHLAKIPELRERGIIPPQEKVT